MHHALLVEQLQIARNKDSVCLKRLTTNLFAVLGVRLIRDHAVHSFFLEHFGKSAEVAVHDEALVVPHWGSQILVGDEGGVVDLALSPVWITIRLLFSLPWSSHSKIFLLVSPIPPASVVVIVLVAWFVVPSGVDSLWTWLDNNLRLLVFTIEFLLIKFIALVVLVQDHVAVVQCFHTLLVWSHIILNRFLYELFDDSNQNVGIESAIVLLRQPERSSLPVRHLFNLADRFLEYSLSYFSQTCLLLHEINFSEVCLGVDEIFNILDKVHLWMLVSKLFDVWAKAESDNGCGLVAENLDQSIVQEFALLKRNEID